MTTWRENFLRHIWKHCKDLPADTSLEDRKKAVQACRPHEADTTSHGRKLWQAARRDYLKPYGYKPKTKPIEQHESPLERMMRRSKL